MDANWSQFEQVRMDSVRAEAPPPGESGAAVQRVVDVPREAPFGVEKVVDRGKLLETSQTLEALHRALMPSAWLVEFLTRLFFQRLATCLPSAPISLSAAP